GVSAVLRRRLRRRLLTERPREPWVAKPPEGDRPAKMESRPGPARPSPERAERGSLHRRDFQDQLQPLVVPQFTHLWQLPLGIMIEPHSGQVGASVRAMKL